MDIDKLREIISRGLAPSLGSADGMTCIEGAISLASGEGLTDTPSCVAAEDRAYAIRINDAAWPSPEARAEALLPLALAQVGTAGTDRAPWVRRLVEGTIRRVAPIYLRHAADLAKGPHTQQLRDAADRCEREGTRESARAAHAAAIRAAYAAVAAYASAAADVRYRALRESVDVALDAYRQEGRHA